MPTSDSVLKEKGRSFYWARFFLGSVYAKRATRLYAFCRYIDDVADENQNTQEAREILHKMALAIRSEGPKSPEIMDGLELMRECHIEPYLVLQLLEGVLLDLELANMADIPELMRYSYLVAGTVGLMMCRIFDVEDEEAFAHAIDLGMAMQLTNICRDVQEDAMRGRCYLPKTLIGNIHPLELIHPMPHLMDPLKASLEALLDLADDYYRSGENGIAYLPIRARVSILVASKVYAAIGDNLRKRWIHRKVKTDPSIEFSQYWSKRVFVSQGQKIFITLKLLLIAPFMPLFWRPSPKLKRRSSGNGIPGRG